MIEHQFFIARMTRFIVPLALLVAVVLPCDAFWFYDKICDGERYNPDHYLCCDDKMLYEWPKVETERVNAGCCNEQMYNFATHKCCRNDLGDVRVVPRKKLHSATCEGIWEASPNEQR
ncbi:hypothetical protein LSAT2_015933 [Lamellibrachia satsuma]|nr:hypothetical protein LSAT2_015933 [Lamellibrachia satsuma]